MKTLKSIAFLFITLVTISSCEEANDIYEEQWYVEELKVSSGDWRLVGNANEIGSYYEYVFDGIPLHISYYKGIVTAYMFFGHGTTHEVQTPLPYTEYVVETNHIGEEFTYSIQYSYDVKADGTIAFKAHISDYYTELFNPGTQYFRVAIIW